MFGLSPLNVVLVLWGIVTAGLAGILIYRALVAMKEEDQLFLTEAERSDEIEQQQLQVRLHHMTPYIKALGIASGVLLFTGAGLWVYEQFSKPMYLP